MDKRLGRARWGAGQPRMRTSAANWRQPARWNAQAERFRQCGGCGWRGEAHITVACPECGVSNWQSARRRVFCASLADVFDNEAPFAWRSDLFALIKATPNLDWLILTKRIGNAAAMIDEAIDAGGRSDHGWPWPNVWLGSTVCNQAEADRDIPKLLDVPVAVHWLSLEPLLGLIDLRLMRYAPLWAGEGAVSVRASNRLDIQWVVVGGESGPSARPMRPDWARSLREQCEEAGAAFLFKQWGEWTPAEVSAGGDLGGELRSGNVQHLHGPGNPEGYFRPGDVYVRRVGKRAAGRKLDGVLHDAYPRR